MQFDTEQQQQQQGPEEEREEEEEMEDPRYAAPTAVCMALHRNLLVAPLLGLGCRLGKHCVPVMEIPKMPLDIASAAADAAGTEKNEAIASTSAMYTWKAMNSIFITLLKHSEDATAIYVHPSDMHYSASSAGSLGRACPVGTALLAQVLSLTHLHSFLQKCDRHQMRRLCWTSRHLFHCHSFVVAKITTS